jgi:hypothetical protein
MNKVLATQLYPVEDEEVLKAAGWDVKHEVAVGV